MNRPVIFLLNTLALLTLAWCASVFAQSSDDLLYFKSDIAVRNQTVNERQFAAQKGLQEVLVRMSGSDALLADSGIQNAISGAQSFVLQFQYKELTDEQLIEEGYSELLSFVFSPQRVEALLVNTKHPYWPTNRPVTLAWLVEDSAEFGRRFVTADTRPVAMKQLELVARTKGIPLISPLYDIDDRLVIGPDDVWALDEAAIVEASKKYGADVILAGRYSQTSTGNVIATWQVVHADQRQTFDVASESIADMINQGVSSLTAWLANIYAIVPGATDERQRYMKIYAVEDFKEYMDALNYLRDLALAKGVFLHEVGARSIIVSIDTDVTLEQMHTIFNLDKRVKPQESITQNSIAGPALMTTSEPFSRVYAQPARGSKSLPYEYVWLK